MVKICSAIFTICSTIDRYQSEELESLFHVGYVGREKRYVFQGAGIYTWILIFQMSAAARDARARAFTSYTSVSTNRFEGYLRERRFVAVNNPEIFRTPLSPSQNDAENLISGNGRSSFSFVNELVSRSNSFASEFTINVFVHFR